MGIYSLEENQKLLDKVKAAKRLERLLSDFDHSLSPAVKDQLRNALELLNADFRYAFGRMLPKKKRAPKPVEPAKVEAS